jgi:hypothetical protein
MRRLRFAAQALFAVSLLTLAARASAAPEPLGPNVWSMQLDGGLFAPLEGTGAGPTAGVRYCKHLGPHLQGGMLTGWSFKRAQQQGPTAEDPETNVELARVDANLVPLMGFMQVDLTEKSWLIPFFGFGVGYEWLMLHSFDHQTGVQVKDRYANVAWETYAGIGLQLNTIWRLNSELYYNGGSLEKKFVQPDGTVQRQAIDVNGVGLRVGLDMKFD